MLILGVDPGLRITGYGVLSTEVRGLKLEEAGVVRGGASGTLAHAVITIHEASARCWMRIAHRPGP